ncbi:MAG: L-histidine N(alpha)-methyltransferase [Acidimicrobiia bacterium]
MRTKGSAPVTIRHLSDLGDRRSQLAADVVAGLTATPKSLPSKYFYDAVGSQLFEDITKLPEYYLTAAEAEILRTSALELVKGVRPEEIIELGSGSSTKTRLLIDAMHTVGSGSRYVPIDVSDAALAEALGVLCSDYPWLEIDGLVGDFIHDLHLIRRKGTRLAIFLGSTIGNLPPPERAPFLAEVETMLDHGDAFLLGVDLVKDEPSMVAAYDDSQGVSAAFNKNILQVLNTELDGDLPLDGFEHVTRFNRECQCMEQSLRATRDMTARLHRLDLDVEFRAGEEIHTEVSCKFTKESLAAEFEVAGLRISEWLTDDADRFALVLARCR